MNAYSVGSLPSPPNLVGGLFLTEQILLETPPPIRSPSRPLFTAIAATVQPLSVCPPTVATVATAATAAMGSDLEGTDLTSS